MLGSGEGGGGEYSRFVGFIMFSLLLNILVLVGG